MCVYRDIERVEETRTTKVDADRPMCGINVWFIHFSITSIEYRISTTVHTNLAPTGSWLASRPKSKSLHLATISRL